MSRSDLLIALAIGPALAPAVAVAIALNLPRDVIANGFAAACACVGVVLLAVVGASFFKGR